MFSYSFSRRPAVSDEVADSSTMQNDVVPNETVASAAVSTVSAPFVNIDIVGHKLEFVNVIGDSEKALECAEGQEAVNDEQLEYSPESETDALSIQLEDLSGSILDNLPSSSNNSVEPSAGVGVGPSPSGTPPTFVFQPIGRLLEQDFDSDEGVDLLLTPSVHCAPQKKNSFVESPQAHPFESSSNAIVIAVPTTSLPSSTDLVGPIVGPKKRGFLFRKLRWSFYSIIAMVFVMWFSTTLFVDERQRVKNPIAEFLNCFAAISSIKPTPSPSMNPTTTMPVTLENLIIPPTVVHDQPISIVEEHLLVKDRDSVSIFTILVPPFFNGAKVGSFPNMTYWPFQSSLFPRWIRNLFMALRIAYTAIQFIVSVAYTFTILLPGLFGILMMMKCINFVLPKPSEKDEDSLHGTRKRITIKADSGKDTFVATDMLISTKSLCGFLRCCQTELSRCGRRSRVAPPADTLRLLVGYNKSAYEGLSIEDLKLVGDFLGLSGLNTLSKHKINLIGAIILQYERILRKLSLSELNEVLEVLNVDQTKSVKKCAILKQIVEAGF